MMLNNKFVIKNINKVVVKLFVINRFIDSVKFGEGVVRLVIILNKFLLKRGRVESLIFDFINNDLIILFDDF